MYSDILLVRTLVFITLGTLTLIYILLWLISSCYSFFVVSSSRHCYKEQDEDSTTTNKMELNNMEQTERAMQWAIENNLVFVQNSIKNSRRYNCNEDVQQKVVKQTKLFAIYKEKKRKRLVVAKLQAGLDKSLPDIVTRRKVFTMNNNNYV